VDTELIHIGTVYVEKLGPDRKRIAKCLVSGSVAENGLPSVIVYFRTYPARYVATSRCAISGRGGQRWRVDEKVRLSSELLTARPPSMATALGSGPEVNNPLIGYLQGKETMVYGRIGDIFVNLCVLQPRSCTSAGGEHGRQLNSCTDT
jgi:hypothetical protein